MNFVRSKSGITKVMAVILIAVVAVAAVAVYYFMQPAPPKVEKVLVAAYASAGRDPDPSYAFADLTSWTIASACYDPLVGLGTSKFADGTEFLDIGKVAATGLAQNWTVSTDGTVYTFKLRQSIKFQNGNPFNATAVKYSYDRALNMGFAGGWLLGFCGMNLNSTKIIDDYTVQITISPNPFLLNGLSFVGIVDPVAVEAHGGVTPGQLNDWMVTHSAGTGAFNLTQYDPSTQAVLVANPNYWQGAPKIDKIIMRFIAETSIRELLIKSGDVDVALGIPAKDVANLQSAANVSVKINPMVRIGQIQIWWEPPFNNTKVREAIAHAIPYDSLINDVMYGYGSLYYSCVSPTGFGYKPALKWDYNLTEARQLLIEAGYSSGFTCTCTIPDNIPDDEQAVVVIMQSELAKIGITMDIHKVAATEFNNLRDTGHLQIWIGAWQPAYNDVTYVSYIWHYSGINYLSTGGYNNTAFDTLTLQSLVETNSTKRTQMCYQLQDILKNDVELIPTYQYPDITAFRSNVKGFKFVSCGAVFFYYLDKT